MKRCTKCGVEQPLENFYAANGTRDGLRGECKACFSARSRARYPQVREAAIERAQRWRDENPERYRETQRRLKSSPEGKRRERAGHLKRKYGMTLEDYDTLLAQQGGVCAICKRPPDEGRSLHVDHDHANGRVRGLLHFKCNNALGDFEDNREWFLAAAAYLDPPDPEVEARIRERVAELKVLAGR